MSGINQSVKVTLRNPLDYSDLLDYYIMPNDSQLARAWVASDGSAYPQWAVAGCPGQ